MGTRLELGSEFSSQDDCYCSPPLLTVAVKHWLKQTGVAITYLLEDLCLRNASQSYFAGVPSRIYGLPIILIKVLGILNLVLESELPEEK